MPRNRKTQEEVREKAKIARRKRYEHIKSNPVLYALEKEKEHQRYIRRKEQKKILSIGDMTPRAKRLQRKKWRENFNKFYQRKLLRQRGIELMNANTPSCSDNEDPLREDGAEADSEEAFNRSEHQHIKADPQPLTTQSQETSTMIELKKKIRRLRYIILKNNKAFKNKINTLKKKVECYKKHIIRLKKRMLSPNSKINEVLLKDKSKLPEAKKKILFCEAIKKTLESNYKGQSKKGKKDFTDAVLGDKSVIKQCNMLTEIKHFSVRSKNKVSVESNQHYDVVKQNIEKFYERDDVSMITSGKKEVITRAKIQKQKRYLLDSLKNLHKIFEQQYCKVSYSFFCKQRPFWVLIPHVNKRDTCACKTHANMEFLVQALNKRRILLEKTSNDVIKSLCCPQTACLIKRCEECQNKILNYLEFNNDELLKIRKWESKKTTYISKGIEKEKKLIEKIEVSLSPKDAIEELEKNLSEFLKHEGLRRWQFSAVHNLKNNLKEHEAIIHVDFSENYAFKYASEVQSFHFGGSRGELTLHTAVIYYVEEGKCTAKSLSTVSENLRHDAAAVWAHLVPLLEHVQTLSNKITTLHFLSDSPSSQYRNKTMFFIITQLYWYLNGLKLLTWNYSESGHGKGAADGVGGTLKRTADAAVAQGKDINNIDSFVEIVTKNTQNIIVEVINDYQIYEKDLLIPKSELLPLKGTLNVHQVIWRKENEELIFREASCFICIDENCTHTKFVGKLKYVNRNYENKENDNIDTRHSKIPKVIIHSNILLNSPQTSNSNVTRLSDIMPDNKLHLHPNIDINEMVRDYNISNAATSFSDYFEDFDRTNRNTLNTRQNISQELERNHLKESHPSIPGSSGLRMIVENCSEDDSFGALPTNLSQVSQRCLESDKSYIGRTAKFEDNIIIKRPTKALLKRFFNSSSDSDSDSDIFPKRQYFKK